ncbi:MAG: hypothetical protein LBC02_14190 [Planctomycetaceae bacterium]|jgi:hypothetical protein|nr:hypothetical protein [Planctomycetaceae bacterium]
MNHNNHSPERAARKIASVFRIDFTEHDHSLSFALSGLKFVSILSVGLMLGFQPIATNLIQNIFCEHFAIKKHSTEYTPRTLKFGFRYKRDFRDNKDFKDMINNKNRSKTEF